MIGEWCYFGTGGRLDEPITDHLWEAFAWPLSQSSEMAVHEWLSQKILENSRFFEQTQNTSV